MGPIRRFLMTMLGARGSTAITVGLHTGTDGAQTVAVYLAEGWRRIAFRLSPDGARRIAAQLTDWADAADRHNSEQPSVGYKMVWKYIASAAGNASTNEGTPIEPAPAQP